MPEYISMHEKQTPRQLAKAQPSPLRISAALQVYVPLAVSCVLRPVSKQAYVEQPGNRTATATGRRHRRALGPVLTRSRSVGRLLFQQGLSEGTGHNQPRPIPISLAQDLSLPTRSVPSAHIAISTPHQHHHITRVKGCGDLIGRRGGVRVEHGSSKFGAAGGRGFGKIICGVRDWLRGFCPCGIGVCFGGAVWTELRRTRCWTWLSSAECFGKTTRSDA